MKQLKYILQWGASFSVFFLLTALWAQAQTPAVDLTAHQSAGALPAGTTLEWHNALPVGAGNLITGTQTTSATPGIYYAVYNYGGSPACYSQPSYLRVLTNTCPATTVDLTTSVDLTTVPASATVTYHSSAVASASNELSSATVTAASTEATYYVAYKTFNSTTNSYCYSEASPVVVVLTGCCPNPSIGGSLTLTGTLPLCSVSNQGVLSLTGQTGTVVKWQTSTNGGTTWTNLVGTAGLTQYSFSNAQNNQQYRAVVNNGGSCSDATSTVITTITSASACSVDCNVKPGSIVK